ncbi:MAG: TIGR00725 family protein [Spirochaetes bacterium]|nr:MAG: TIGR00725 family protein [Spirochaetota bacterium]
MLIGVIGSSTASEKAKEIAYSVGREIIKQGYYLICGGLGGVMEAASKGAYDASGGNNEKIIGILPGHAKGDANNYVGISIPTGIGFARNMIIACSSDAVIAVEGGSGTLSEISMAWQYGKPIIVMKGSGGISETLIGKQLDSRRDYKIEGADNPYSALEIIKRQIII